MKVGVKHALVAILLTGSGCFSDPLGEAMSWRHNICPDDMGDSDALFESGIDRAKESGYDVVWVDDLDPFARTSSTLRRLEIRGGIDGDRAAMTIWHEIVHIEQASGGKGAMMASRRNRDDAWWAAQETQARRQCMIVLWSLGERDVDKALHMCHGGYDDEDLDEFMRSELITTFDDLPDHC